MTVRAKFYVHSITTSKAWNGPGTMGTVHLSPVTSGSDENKKFYEATPGGKIELGHRERRGAEAVRHRRRVLRGLHASAQAVTIKTIEVTKQVEEALAAKDQDGAIRALLAAVLALGGNQEKLAGHLAGVINEVHALDQRTIMSVSPRLDS
jgi:hypothetical protein